MLDLLKTQKARDRQTTIGASAIGDPCAYCLARHLSDGSSSIGQYWLGAKIGDAIHMLMELEAQKHVGGGTDAKFKSLIGARLEESVFIGTIPGYGDVNSTPDLYLTAEKHLVDYKTSKRSKIDEYRLNPDALPTRYLYQIMLYGRALVAMGYPVEKVSFVFIARDGTSDRDVTVISFDYDETLADEAWNRVVLAYEWLQDGGDIDTLESDPHCYVCSQILHRM
jgi:hypothetical protein